MRMRRLLYLGVAVIAIAVIWAGAAGTLSAQQGAGGAVRIDGNAIGGVVTGPSGPEAGVWVIAETTDLPTRFARMVVTDDQGRYVVPDLPKVKYKVWVRGYGLVDSAKVDGEPGKNLNLRAVAAPSEAAAAQYYPAIYWYSMLKIPDTDQFGGKSNIPANISQSDYLVVVKNRACVGCHQLGQLSTRTIPASLGQFESGEKAWIRRVQSGQAAPLMLNPLTQVLGGVPFKYFGDWTDRVAKGELPHSKPPRPSGVERNIVVTTWEWGDPKKYLHDLIASDRRYPTVNAYGKLYGSPEYATDDYPILDPKTHTVTTFRAPVRDADTPEALGPGHAAIEKPMAPSPYWGEEKLWDTKANNHNGMFDRKGRVWFAAVVRGPKNPEFCQKGSDHPSAKLFPLERTNRALTFLDPKTMKYTFVDTCFQTHHLQFGYDANETVWTSGGGQVLGWVNTKMFDETGDAAKSQGWTAFVLDTNGNGKRDDYVEPDQPVDPTKDKRIAGGFYAVMPSPVDGSIWGSVGVFGGTAAVVRVVPGPNPPATALAEIYNVPKPYFGIRGADIDKQGVVWASMGSGHIGSFDRRKCKGPLNGPKATGDHCP
ncbi:MAG TPA: carboxypeptidase-like regulatory domain-containing protein, partial [Methylomirabilota bacterium]|nr:carboxypeptidase-like regulatory domain-containing protein [Methylomirabilota bacterium]